MTRNAFQRIYDMIMSYGAEEFIDAKKRLIRYKFFSDMTFDQDDAIFGLEIPLMRLVNFFKGAAQGYRETRAAAAWPGRLSKSTIVRRLKKGLEHFSRTEDGALYTFDWYPARTATSTQPRSRRAIGSRARCTRSRCILVPPEMRERFLEQFNEGREERDRVTIIGDLCPSCRYNYRELMLRYDGDWGKTIQHVRVRRLIFSEQDRRHRHVPAQGREEPGLD